MLNTDNWFSKSKYFEISIPKPVIQGVFVLGVSTLMMLGGLGFEGGDWPWTVAGAFILLFTVFNNGLGIFANKFSVYFQQSAYTFMGLLVVLGFLAYFISGESIFAGKGINRTIYLVLILAYFSLLGIAFMIRNVADFLKNRDEEMQKKGRL
jgi:hypothetical protein